MSKALVVSSFRRMASVELAVELPCRSLDQQKVVMQTTPTDEGALVRAYNVGHTWCHAGGENLGHTMDKANRTEILDLHRIRLLGQERDQRLVGDVQAPRVTPPQSLKGLHDVGLDDRPSSGIERASETIGP
jgi:hypothetical protein